MNQVGKSDRDKVHVVFCANRQYFQHTAVAAASMLEASQSHYIVIHIITSDYDSAAEEKLSETIRRYSRAELVIHRVNDSRTDAAFTDDYRTKEAYFRFLAPEVLPLSVKRVVYLDSDIVVLDDIAKLASIDLEGRAVGAVVDCDWGRGTPDVRLAELGVAEDHTYVGSGVLVMDLDLWRSQGIAQRLFECVERLGRGSSTSIRMRST